MIYIQSFFYHGGGRYIADTKHRKTTHPTNQQSREAKGQAQGTPTEREVFAGGKNGGVGVCRRTGSTRGDKGATAGRKKAGGRRAQLGPTPPGGTRGENTRHRTGTKHSRRRTRRAGSIAKYATDRKGARAENSKQRRKRKQRPHEDSKGEEASIVADSRQREQEL